MRLLIPALALFSVLPLSAQTMVAARDFIFVPAQHPVDASGQTPESFDAQARLALDNLKKTLSGGSLSLAHLVWAQVYLEDVAQIETFERVYADVFGSRAPALAVLGVAAVGDDDSLLAVDGIAFHDAGAIERAADGKAVSAGGLTFLSAAPGRDLATGAIPPTHAEQARVALDNLGATLKAAGLGYEHMVFTHPYLLADMRYGDMNKVYATYFEFGATPARATIFVDALPRELTIEYTGVAVRDLSKREPVRPKNMQPSPTASPCVWGEDLYFCSGKSGFIPGVGGGVWASTVENQFRQTMRNLLDNLEETGLDFSAVVSTHVYLDDIRDMPRIQPIYDSYFPGRKPALTVVQQLPSGSRQQRPSGHWPAIEQMALIAARP